MTGGSSTAPLVSIIVPVFNGEDYLRESLDSILAQTYPRIEIVVLDDASTDRTPEIIASYGDRVRYRRIPENRGQYVNDNEAIAAAHGEYIAIYHADDVYDPCIVEKEVAALERYPEAGAAFCKDIFIDLEGHEVGRLQIPREVQGGHPLSYPVVFNALLTYKNHFLRCPSCLVRASVYRDVGTYRQDQFHNTADLEMYLRIARKYPLVVVDEYLFRYRRGHSAMSSRYRHLRQKAENFFMIMDRYLADGGKALATSRALAEYEAHRAEDLLMVSVNHYILDQRAAARNMLRQVRACRILVGHQIQRGRLMLLYLAMQMLARMPRIGFIAEWSYRRWHSGVDQAKRGRSDVRHSRSGVVRSR
ncbi:MAG: glycosyltransferase [Nitrospira sp.]|nr:glycosyltransferase [Nitrospira sp.]